jgi:hypothetical protein
MILILFGIYALVAAKWQISRHYGLRGKGARIVGAVCIGFGLGFFTVLSVSAVAATRALSLPDGAAAAMSAILQIALLIAILTILVRLYGNAFAKTPPSA